jgi:hypothetical protein
MTETINWPSGEFTIQTLVALNPAFPQALVRKKLSAAITAKSIVQTRKGDGKIQGAFQVVKAAAAD